jgi:hypothetical protein
MRFYKQVLPAILFLLLSSPAVVSAQHIAVKTNLLYGAYTLTPNLGVEAGLGRRSTLDVGVGYNPWNLKGSVENNKKLVHLLGSVEYRQWLCQKFNGHFFGVHLLGTKYNISAHELPLLFGKSSGAFRHQGWGAGAGISYGYQFVLGRHWNLELTLGVGYAYLKYDKYDCPKCGTMTDSVQKHYFGPTKGGLSILYVF